MRRRRVVAVKVAYDGSGFFGFQRQSERSTVEGAIVKSLLAIGAIDSVENSAFRSSSRTDRGVSAICNIVSFSTAFPTKSLCAAMNSNMRCVWAYGVSEVPDDFNPRWARQRWYRYHLPGAGRDVRLVKRLATRFEGEHDFSAFARKSDRDPVRTIDSIDVAEHGHLILLDFRAESFLWNMIRRIVWALDAASRHEMDPDLVGPEVRRHPGRTGLAPAEFLVLMDVDCGVEFAIDDRAVKAMAAEFEGRSVRASVSQEFSEQLLNILRPPSDHQG